MSKKLVVYFSAERGKTADLAKNVAAAAGADISEIRPTVPYSADDLYWPNFRCRSVVEMHTPGFFQEMLPMDVDVLSYDVIFVGFPVWCETAPTIIRTFLKSYDFTGKQIIPFCTSGGGNADEADGDFKKYAPGAKLTPYVRMNRASAAKVADWVKSLKLD